MHVDEILAARLPSSIKIDPCGQIIFWKTMSTKKRHLCLNVQGGLKRNGPWFVEQFNLSQHGGNPLDGDWHKAAGCAPKKKEKKQCRRTVCSASDVMRNWIYEGLMIEGNERFVRHNSKLLWPLTNCTVGCTRIMNTCTICTHRMVLQPLIPFSCLYIIIYKNHDSMGFNGTMSSTHSAVPNWK